MKQTVEGKPSLKKGDSENKLDVKRNDVLTWLREDIEWLRKHARQKYIGKNFMLRVHALRASIYGASTLLSGLKDEELELRVEELEKIIQNGVVIPSEKDKQKVR